MTKHECDGVDIDVRACRVTQEEFRGHVLWGTQDGAYDSEPLVVAVHGFCDAKVEYFDKIVFADDFSNEDVIGFEIAVDDASLVSFVDAFEDLCGDMDGSREGQTIVAFEKFSQAVAFDVFHDDVEVVVVVGACVDELDGIGVDEIFDDGGFAEEALDDRRVFLRVQAFKGDDAIDADLSGAVDDAEAAACNFIDDFVAMGNDVSHVKPA